MEGRKEGGKGRERRNKEKGWRGREKKRKKNNSVKGLVQEIYTIGQIQGVQIYEYDPRIIFRETGMMFVKME
jgi:hypothetical protein